MSAINDVDTLAQSLTALGVAGADAGRVLSESLGKAIDAAGTVRAVDAVRERIVALGTAGRLSGEQLATALQKAKDKADALLPGINSLSEAMHTFGLESTEQAGALAMKFGEAYATMAQSSRVSLAQQRDAFNRWAAEATAANAGIEPSAVHLARVILEIKEAATTTADGSVAALGRIKDAAVSATQAIQQVNGGNGGDLSSNGRDAVALHALEDKRNNTNGTIYSAPIDTSTGVDLAARYKSRTLNAGDLANARANFDAEKANLTFAQSSLPATFSPEGRASQTEDYNVARNVLQKVSELAAQATAARKGTDATDGKSTSHTVTINVGGKSTAVSVSTSADADALLAVLNASAKAAGASVSRVG